MPFCTNCGANVEGQFCPNCGTAMTPQQPAAPPAYPPPAAPPAAAPPVAGPPVAKKRSPWMYVLFGCLGLLVIVIVGIVGAGWYGMHKLKQAGLDPALIQRNPALAAAKIMTATNSNIEIVSVDEGRQLITFREKSTGKTVTLNFNELQKGNISFSGSGGERVSIQGGGGSWNPPSWLPMYAGAKVEHSANLETAAEDGGTAMLTTSDSSDDVVKFYENALSSAGMEVTKQTTSFGGASGAVVLVGQKADENQHVSINVMNTGGATQIQITYSIKK
jgi:hypothetical protein